MPYKLETAINSGPWLEMQRYDAYDRQGNPLAVTAKGAAKAAYLWGYGGQYAVAQAENASHNEVFHANFEEGVGWQPNLSYDYSFRRTGRASGKIVNTGTSEKVAHATISTAEAPGETGYKWLNVSLSQAKRFTYSAWVYSDGPVAELFLFMKDAQGRDTPGTYFTQVAAVSTSERGKWVLLEGEALVPAQMVQLGLRLDNNGAANGGQTVWFDDVRLHPSEARMETFTHDPLVGMTSSSDANGRPTFFEYDGFGRLSVVRDAEGNILKRHDYRYKGQ